MKKVFLLSLFLAAMCTMTFANFSVDWIRTADISFNTGTSVTRDASDNVYTTSSNGSIYLEKRDRFGNLLWQVSSFTTIAFNYEYPVMVHVDPQGYPVVVGYRYTTSSEGHFANSLIVLKYDPNGNLIYKHNFDGTYTYFNQSQYWTRVSSQMDALGNLYIGTAGNVSGYPTWGFNAIKVSTAGNITWVTTKSFPSSTTFHFVSSIRLKGNKLGLTGSTSYANSNATSWVLNTSGTDLWNNISTGGGGKDIAFDNNGKTYVLTSVSTASTADVNIYKFNGTGGQQWSHNYDFGGSELCSRMELTPDGNLAIMAYGNTAPNGSWYVDWITMKVDLNGILIWSDRFDEHANNDEIPYMMAVDAGSNIFVTGIAGPYPGGSNLGKRQMVTVKYSPSGTREWASAIDSLSEYNTGIGIAIASDGSLYVVGNTTTFIVHYLDNTGSDPCLSPVNVGVFSITADAASISWNAVANAYLYHLQFKPTTSLTWQQVSTNSTSFTLASLFPGTAYDYQVEAICNSGPTGYSSTQQFTTLGSGYCASEGLDASSEWIDLVYLGTMLNSTPVSDGGYADFTNLSTDLVQGSSYEITLSAGMDPGSFTEKWKVWIDYNQDGDFIDAGEREVSYKSSQVGWETHTFTVPLIASLGVTRMRVSMKHGVTPAPCETFARGEVEDYTINILVQKIGSVEEELSLIEKLQLAVYPNPTVTTLNVILNGSQGNVTLEIFDLSGKLMLAKQSSSGQSQIDVHELAGGFYILRAMDEGGNITTIKWIKE